MCTIRKDYKVDSFFLSFFSVTHFTFSGAKLFLLHIFGVFGYVVVVVVVFHFDVKR